MFARSPPSSLRLASAGALLAAALLAVGCGASEGKARSTKTVTLSSAGATGATSSTSSSEGTASTGSGSSTVQRAGSPVPSSVATQASAICARRNQELRSYVTEGSAQRMVTSASRRAAIQRRALSELEKLSPPSTRAAKDWRLMLVNTRLAMLRTAALARYKGSSEAALRRELAVLNRPQLGLLMTATRLGAKQCALVIRIAR